MHRLMLPNDAFSMAVRVCNKCFEEKKGDDISGLLKPNMDAKQLERSNKHWNQLM